MSQQVARTLLALSVLSLPGMRLRADQPSDSKEGAQAARDALAGFEKSWKPVRGSMRRLDDPSWKVQFEALVKLVKAGPDAVAVLEDASKTGEPRTREFAGYVLGVLRGSPAVRRALADYDVGNLDTGRVGTAAPDFSLADVTGKTCRLGQFRDRKAVVLVFLIDYD